MSRAFIPITETRSIDISAIQKNQGKFQFNDTLNHENFYAQTLQTD